MNNLGLSLKKFFTNKNTVTIIGVVAILVILYFMYTKQIKKATKEIDVPVAKQEILPQTEITDSMVTTIKIAQAAKPKDVLTSKGSIIGRYTGVGVTIPQNGMFYGSLLTDTLPGGWLKELEPQDEANPLELQRPYSFPVNVATTFGNSIQPGDYVDFYLKAYDESKNIIYGRIFTNMKVLAVTDSQGKDVFRSQNSIGTPAYLNFGLNDEDYRIFKYVEYASGDLSLVVVPRGGKIEDEKTLQMIQGTTLNASEAKSFVKGKGTTDDKYKNIWDQGYNDVKYGTAIEEGTEENTNTQN